MFNIMGLSLNWMSTLLIIMLIPMSFWFFPYRFMMIWSSIILILHKELKTLLGPFNYKASTFSFISLFSLIVFNNFMGLFPYIYTSSSHLSMTLSLALPLWLNFMLFGWIKNTQHMFAHLVPQGTPAILMPFMVCIETISNLIRPGTLPVRLAANMIAGHMLLTSLGNTRPMLSSWMISLLILTQILLLVLEFAVSIIQSYVFAILRSLYSSEVI